MSKSGARKLCPTVLRYLRVVAFELSKLIPCVLIAELVLRFGGYESPYVSKGVHPGIIGDPVLGWRHKPGRYLMSDATSVPPRTFATTFLDDGTRDVGGSGRGPLLALFGCSFIDGYGLDDRETIAWKLRERLPQFAVKNYGVSGYGTYSALLSMRAANPQPQRYGRAIMVYGFADFHAPRNVKNPALQRHHGNPSDNAQESVGSYPVCDDNGCGVWYGSTINPWLRSSRFLALVKSAWDAVWFLTHLGEAERVTDRLLLQMKEETAARSARLILAPVTQVNERWRDFFTKNNFEVVECVSSDMKAAEYVQADLHPNDRWTTKYAECLANYLTASKRNESGE